MQSPTPGNKTQTLPLPSRTKIIAITVVILLAIIAVIAVIVTGSGYIAKLMMKASSCNETMVLLVTAGVLTAIVFMGLGYLLRGSIIACLNNQPQGESFTGPLLDLMPAEEQYRYYRRQSDMLNL